LCLTSSHHTPSSSSFFFCYCSCHPRALPSFPTRRSSDLRDPGTVQLSHLRTGDVLGAQHRCLVDHPCRLGDARAHGGQHRGDPEDRKSTRLNSSHVSISYAVFCLKKKTKNQQN